mgnify:FL=1
MLKVSNFVATLLVASIISACANQEQANKPSKMDVFVNCISQQTSDDTSCAKLANKVK